MKDIRDIEKRRALAQQLRWLIGGRITNDQFDDFLYEENCLDSKDTTIAEIANWSWGLYSDLVPYRLKGRHTVSEEVRTVAIRAIVLLRSGEDYKWPQASGPFSVGMLSIANSVASYAAIAMAIIAFPLWWGDTNWVGDEKITPRLFGVVAALVGVSYGAHALCKRIMRPIVERFEAAGDRECWPFLCKNDLAKAMEQGRLLAKD